MGPVDHTPRMLIVPVVRLQTHVRRKLAALLHRMVHASRDQVRRHGLGLALGSAVFGHAVDLGVEAPKCGVFVSSRVASSRFVVASSEERWVLFDQGDFVFAEVHFRLFSSGLGLT